MSTEQFTQDQLNNILAKERRSHEAAIAELQGKLEAFEPVQKQLAELQTEHTKLQAVLTERDAQIAAAAERTKQETVNSQLAAELARANVMPALVSKAQKLATLEIRDVQIGDDGEITATYGDLAGKPFAEVVRAWTADNEHYLPPPAGGSGAKSQNGTPVSRPLVEMRSIDLLMMGGEK